MDKKDDLTILNRYRLPVMGAAALYVLFLHTGVMVSGGLLVDILTFIRRMGFIGVDVFLLLSGIGMVYSYEKEKRDILIFWKRRIRRILMPMLIAAVCYGITDHWSFREFIEYVSGYHYYMVVLEKSFLWFYFAIATFYLLFPLYYKLFDISSDKNVFTVMMICIWLALGLTAQGHIRDDLYWMINRIPIFLTGIWLGNRLREGKTEIKGYIYLIMAAALVLGYYLEYLILYREQKMLLPYSEFGLAAYLSGISFAFLWAKGFAVLDRITNNIGRHIGKGIIKICSFFGRISYEFYCMQEWVFERLIAVFVGNIGIISLNVLVFISCVGAGLIVYWINQWFWKGCQYIFSKKE